uniref:Uncharacterized protein n=1 Tax=viral metagenome TaxID=1070528 RepID=A0A6M3XM62_9ZZZZ
MLANQKDTELARVPTADGPDVVVYLTEETMSDGSTAYKVVLICGGGTVLIGFDAGDINEATALFSKIRTEVAPTISCVEVIAA